MPNRTKSIKKGWCVHITHGSSDGGRNGWVMIIEQIYTSVIKVPPSWKVCPICQAERPTKTNIKAAELRFAMDNDQ